MRDMSGAANVTESHPPNVQPKDSVGINNSAEFQLSHSLSFLNSYDRYDKTQEIFIKIEEKQRVCRTKSKS